MIKASENLATLALTPVVVLETQAAQHRSIARSYERRLSAPDALRRSQREVDWHDAKAAEQESLAAELRIVAIDVKVTVQERRARRRTS